MLTGSSQADVLNAKSITAVPYVSAEWNYNLFYPPHVTVAGTGTKIAYTTNAGSDTITSSSSIVKENFTTKKITTTTGTATAILDVSSLSAKSYKIVTYVRTNSSSPITINTFATSTVNIFGGKSEEAVAFAWTKIETYISANTTLSSFSYYLKATAKEFKSSTNVSNFELYFTEPEFYEISDFSYENDSIWSTDSAFNFMRPGESYIGTGNANISFPTNFRKVEAFSGYSTLYMPCSRVMYNPKLIIVEPPKYDTTTASIAKPQNPLLKNGMPSDISLYKYFVSDTSNKKITGIYEKDLYVNKLVLKFNTIITTPIVSITLTNSSGSTTISGKTPSSTGELVLYWNGSTWSETKWSSMPKFDSAGLLALKTTVQKITVEQTSYSIKTDFDNANFTAATTELGRMQVIEISPRLEIDISNDDPEIDGPSFVMSININKTLDNKSTPLPISGMESNDASISLSGIPAYSVASGLIPIFSNDSDNVYTILSGMLRKGVKFYTYLKITNASTEGDINNFTNEYIPTGIFYSDSWSQQDIDSVDIQCYDVTRLLQNFPVPDYAGQFQNITSIITNLLDFAGFTDYDYDSLVAITENKNVDFNISHFFANSKEVTIFDAIRQILSSYQIGAYIDEYGVMQFLGLADILNKTSADIEISDANIVKGGYSLSTNQKAGKIAMKYTPPKILMSASDKNLDSSLLKNSGSYYLTRSNDIVWTQESDDSVGFNYLFEDMTATQNYFKLDVTELTDIFHTFNRDYDGYAIIEDEIVSFKYKEYEISKPDASIAPINVSVKNTSELNYYENEYQKTNMIGIGASPKYTYSTDTINNNIYDIQVAPTGKITNVQRGLFGSKIGSHALMTSLASKSLYAKYFNGSSMTDSTDIVSTNKQLTVKFGDTTPTLIYPITSRDDSYKTYSTSFTMNKVTDTANNVTAGVFFNMPSSQTSITGTYFVGLRWDITNSKYYVNISQHNGTTYALLYETDITALCYKIMASVPQVFKDNDSYNPFNEDQATRNKFKKKTETLFNLKVVHDIDDPGNASMNFPAMGNVTTGVEFVRVYLNNNEIRFLSSGSNALNVMGMPKPITISSAITNGSIFGAYCLGADSANSAQVSFREIYATQYALVDKKDSYFHKTQYFLNCITQNKNVKYSSYLMQTKPAASGINIYDVQYSNPNSAASIVDVNPVEYTMFYQPPDELDDLKYRQSFTVTEGMLKYSSPISTGFRSKFAVANDTPVAIILKTEPTQDVITSADLTLFTYQAVSLSDEVVIEKEINRYNASEVVQFDSRWVQSKDSATSILNNAMAGLDGFSKNIQIKIYGNPFIQVGDVVNLNYSLAGIVNQKHIVHSVSQDFSSGLTTSLVLNKI